MSKLRVLSARGDTVLEWDERKLQTGDPEALAAVREEVGRFERCLFSLLEELVPCDAGWTGVATQEENRPVNHNSFVYHLPENFFREWLDVINQDPCADLTRLVYGQATIVNTSDEHVNPMFRSWAGQPRCRMRQERESTW